MICKSFIKLQERLRYFYLFPPRPPLRCFIKLMVEGNFVFHEFHWPIIAGKTRRRSTISNTEDKPNALNKTFTIEKVLKQSPKLDRFYFLSLLKVLRNRGSRATLSHQSIREKIELNHSSNHKGRLRRLSCLPVTKIVEGKQVISFIT